LLDWLTFSGGQTVASPTETRPLTLGSGANVRVLLAFFVLAVEVVEQQTHLRVHFFVQVLFDPLVFLHFCFYAVILAFRP